MKAKILCCGWTFPLPSQKYFFLKADELNARTFLQSSTLQLCQIIDVSIFFQSDNFDGDVIEDLQYYQCTSRHQTAWVMSICGLKGILLLFGVFLAWETRNVHYPALNDSKNIGLAVYNVFMFSCLALVVEFVVTYPPLKMLVGRSVTFVGTTSTICLLFVPKVRTIPNSVKTS